MYTDVSDRSVDQTCAQTTSFALLFSKLFSNAIPRPLQQLNLQTVCVVLLQKVSCGPDLALPCLAA